MIRDNSLIGDIKQASKDINELKSNQYSSAKGGVLSYRTDMPNGANPYYSSPIPCYVTQYTPYWNFSPGSLDVDIVVNVSKQTYPLLRMSVKCWVGSVSDENLLPNYYLFMPGTTFDSVQGISFLNGFDRSDNGTDGDVDIDPNQVKFKGKLINNGDGTTIGDNTKTLYFQFQCIGSEEVSSYDVIFTPSS